MKFTHPEVEQLGRIFQGFVHYTRSGVEYWFGRDLHALVGNSDWDHFNRIVDDARQACISAGNDPIHHFAIVTKIVDFGLGSQVKIDDFIATRYACDLIVRCMKEDAPLFDFAKVYFSIFPFRADFIAKTILEDIRINNHNHVIQSRKDLRQAIGEWTKSDQDMRLFWRMADQALFGCSADVVRTRWGVPANRTLADFVPSAVLKSMWWAAQVTMLKIGQHGISSKLAIRLAHTKHLQQARRDLARQGVQTEKLRPEVDIKDVRAHRSAYPLGIGLHLKRLGD